MTSSRRTNWVGPLDSYRSLAALAVFGFHIASIDPPSGVVGELTIPLGSAAVSLFFALSGFLIYRPFAAWAFGAGSPVPGARFALRRIARIIPVYWVVLSIHLFVFDRGDADGLGDYITAFGLVQNFRGSKVFIPPFVAWSLSIELWFSMCLPAIAYIFRKAGAGRNVQTRAAIQVAGFVWLGGVATVFRIWALSRPRSGGELLWFPAYFDWFAVGIILAILTTYWKIVAPPETIRRLAEQPLPLALGVVSYWAVTKIGIPGGFTPPTSFQTHAQFLLQAAMSFCLLSAAVLPNARLGSGAPNLFTRALGWLAPLSYGIYLVHPVVVDEILHRSNVSRLVLAPVALFVTVACAYAIHHLVERPSSRFADRHLRPPALEASSRQTTGSDSSHQPTAVERPAVARSLNEPVQCADNNEAAGQPSSDTSPKRVNPDDGVGTLGLINRMSVLTLISGALSMVVTLLARPGVYVADARYELFADPVTRLTRSFQLWDSSRDFGRVAEEFWPGLVLFSTAVASAGAPTWVSERLLHAGLLTIACAGAMYLSRTLGRLELSTTVFAGAIYAFGPFSATYLVPSPLYVSYALAPWAVIGVLKAARDENSLRWAGITALGIFMAGNADVPGLIYALVPALITWLACLAGRPSSRRPLGVYTAATLLTAGLASAAMLAKTSAGAAALSHRLIETESAVAVSTSSSMAESMRGMGFWLSYFQLGPLPVRTQGQLFLNNWFMVVLTFAPLVAGVALLAWRRKPSDVLALGWLIAAIVLMTGPHPINNPSPYGAFLLDLYQQSDVAFGFRSTHKAGTGLALATAILGSAGLAHLPRLISPRKSARRWLRGLPALLILLAYTQPFWRTPLYDPSFVNADIPAHWGEVEDWFQANPPSGRVLVLPGSTNNGYRWGSVGDDLLDPIIPRRLTASTLPLSTSLASNITEALDAMTTSDRYRPGSLGPLAAQLGISHVVIRNDLDWELQGIARPRSLQGLRLDPDLERVAAFGVEGLFSTSQRDPIRDEVERTLPAVEVFAINVQTSPIWRLPATESARQVLLSGDGVGLTAAASVGLLSEGHPVRFAAGLETDEILGLANDVAFLVLTDTNRQSERRIRQYGFIEIPLLARAAELSPTANHWLPNHGETESQTTMRLDGATIDSSVDIWLLGPDHQPFRAVDDDQATSWVIPFLAQGESQHLTIALSEENDSTHIEIDLVDAGERATDINVLLDGLPTPSDRSNSQLTVTTLKPFSTLEIRFESIEPGLQTVGVREIRFDKGQPTLRTMLPTELVDQISASSTLQRAFSDTPLAVVFADVNQPGAQLSRELILWRSDTFTLEAEVFFPESDPTETSVADSDDVTTISGPRWPTDGRCFYGPVQIDNSYIAVVLEPNDESRGTLHFCDGPGTVTLEAGPHRLTITPPPNGSAGTVVLHSAHEFPLAVQRYPLDLDSPEMLEAGDLLVTDMSFDADWAVSPQSLDGATAVSLTGLTAWEVQTSDLRLDPVHRLAPTFTYALYVTLFGLACCVGLIALKQPSFTRPLIRSSDPTTSRRPMGATITPRTPPARLEAFTARTGFTRLTTFFALARSTRLGRMHSLATKSCGYTAVAIVGYFFLGPMGLAGTGAALALGLWVSPRALFALGAAGIAATALVTAQPLLASTTNMVDARTDALLARVVVGFLFATTVHAQRSLRRSAESSETH